jgi:beta-catenin-like protein 1
MSASARAARRFLTPCFQAGHKKSKKAPTATHSALEDEEHVLSILSSLFTSLDSDSVPRIRLLAKFVESDYEKVDRLIEMMEAAENRLKAVNQEIELEQQVSLLVLCNGYS